MSEYWLVDFQSFAVSTDISREKLLVLYLLYIMYLLYYIFVLVNIFM